MRARIAGLLLMAAPVALSAKTVTSGIDLSRSSGIHNGTIAAGAARHVSERLSLLQSGDRVVVRVFGDGSAGNAARIDGSVTSKDRGSDWGAAIAQMIAGIANGALGMQEMTRIAEFLEWTPLGCADAGGGEVIVLTDGLEHSSYVTERAFRNGARLPNAAPGSFAGCTIRFVGLGTTNRGEIPGNMLDDDNNGYVDDYYGWNFERGNSDVNDSLYGKAVHGTRVNGFIGAVGNNNIGITGVMWKVKLLNANVKDNSTVLAVFESDVIQSYFYVIEQRRAYNNTDGASGAFVVACNSSWSKIIAPFTIPFVL